MDIKFIFIVGSVLIGSCMSAGPCSNDAGCAEKPGDFCDTTSGSCVECLVDGACTAPADKCNHDTNMCVECLNDGDCSSPEPICNSVTGECEAECTVDGECKDNEDCDTTLGWCVCETDGDTCNEPGEECNEEGNCGCGAGFVRESVAMGRCVPDCNPRCPDGQICTRDLQCECGPTQIKEDGGTCVACTLECQKNMDCKIEGQTCNSINKCECPSGEKLFSGRCVERGKLGGYCKNGSCRGRYVKCDRSTDMCMCSGRNCYPLTFCAKGTSCGLSRYHTPAKDEQFANFIISDKIPQNGTEEGGSIQSPVKIKGFDRRFITFSFQGVGDAFLLFERNTNSRFLLLIEFGGNVEHNHVAFASYNGEHKWLLTSTVVNGITSPTESRSYWVSWKVKTISFGLCSVPQQNVILTYTFSKNIPAFERISVSTTKHNSGIWLFSSDGEVFDACNNTTAPCMNNSLECNDDQTSIRYSTCVFNIKSDIQTDFSKCVQVCGRTTFQNASICTRDQICHSGVCMPALSTSISTEATPRMSPNPSPGRSSLKRTATILPEGDSSADISSTTAFVSAAAASPKAYDEKNIMSSSNRTSLNTPLAISVTSLRTITFKIPKESATNVYRTKPFVTYNSAKKSFSASAVSTLYLLKENLTTNVKSVTLGVSFENTTLPIFHSRMKALEPVQDTTTITTAVRCPPTVKFTVIPLLLATTSTPGLSFKTDFQLKTNKISLLLNETQTFTSSSLTKTIANISGTLKKHQVLMANETISSLCKAEKQAYWMFPTLISGSGMVLLCCLAFIAFKYRSVCKNALTVPATSSSVTPDEEQEGQTNKLQSYRHLAFV